MRLRTPKRDRSDDVEGLNSCAVAIAVFVATGDRAKARDAGGQFGGRFGYRAIGELTYTELFEFLEGVR